MRGYWKYLIFVVFLVFCGVITFLLISNVEDEEDNYFVSEFLICTNTDEYEIKVNQQNKYTIFIENGIEEVMYAYPREGKSRLVFPDLDEIRGEDTLEGRKQIVNYTYNMSYTDGFKYLKYLLDTGFYIDMYVSTPQYIEVFLLKDSVYKRIVLFSDTLMVCDMVEGTELPPVWEYLESYNFNGFIEDKFNIEFENNSK